MKQKLAKREATDIWRSIQRIALARGIYSNPKIYILDEFTNALDKETEKILLEKFLQFAKEKTIFLSTHNKDLLNICNEAVK